MRTSSVLLALFTAGAALVLPLPAALDAQDAADDADLGTPSDPQDDDLVYSEMQGGGLFKISQATGELQQIAPFPGAGEGKLRFNWNTPYLAGPSGASTTPDWSCRFTSTAMLRPMRSGCAASCLGSSAIRTGTRCTILIQLPVAFCAGSSENALPVPTPRLCTMPL